MQRPLVTPTRPRGWMALAMVTFLGGIALVVAALGFGAHEDHFWQGIVLLTISVLPIVRTVDALRAPVYPRFDVVAGMLYVSPTRVVPLADLGELVIEKRLETDDLHIYSHGLHARYLDKAIIVEFDPARTLACKMRLERVMLAHAFRRLLATPEGEGAMRSVDVTHELLRLAGQDAQRASLALNTLLIDEHDPAIRRRAASVKLA